LGGKKVKAHCKVVFVLGEREGKRMILGVRVGSSYGDERKMRQILTLPILAAKLTTRQRRDFPARFFV